jgi:S1-C subfamily serine protease
MRRLFAIALALLVGGALAPAARAGDTDVKALEKTFEKIASEATPKTVCVKSYIEKTGDKAGYGSGAIISADGYILTCSHVVDIAKRCEVILSSGKIYPAKLLGRNKKQDYALIKIDETGLPFYEIGDSKSVDVGQWVMALGHPGGPYEDVQPAFAAGRITALHRKLPVQMMDRFYDDGIQTDVPIFAGNSGGPLVDLSGKLIGLNGAIILLNDNAFAVPIHEAVADLDTLKSGENVAGREPTQEDMAEFQREIDPEMFNKMMERGLKNLGKLFGGENGENPFGKMFGEGGNGDLGKMFGKLFGEQGGDLGKMFGKLFGQGKKDKGTEDKDDDKDDEGGAEGMDLGKMLQQFMKSFGGNGKDGENPFGKMFGQGGEGGDLGKMMKQLQKMMGGMDDKGDDDDDDAPKAPGTQERPAEKASDKGGYLGVKAAADKDAEGVLVDDVLANSPAEKAGLKKGDVVVAVNGKLTQDVAALQAAIRSVAPGETAKVTVDRTKVLDTTVVRERIEIKVTILARPAPTQPQDRK